METLPNNLQTTENKIETPPMKEGVDFVFEQHPELESIGTKEQYSEYIHAVFPDSKLRDVIYHGGDGPLTNFEKREGGIFFTKDAEYALKYAGGDMGNITPVVLDAKEPRSVPQVSRTLIAVDYKEAIERDGADALIGEESLGIVHRKNENFLAKGKSTVVFSPEQIHILGSEQDIGMFRDFVESQKSKP